MPDEKDFTIKDRRVFSSESKEEKSEEPEKEETPKEEQVASDDTSTPEQSQSEAQLPEINFATFIMSLNASAMVSLGVIDDPVIGTKTKNLPVGKQTIDILAMLEEKTVGNLTDDEAAMLKNILYDLRILYVKESG